MGDRSSEDVVRVSDQLVASYASVSTATIHEASGGRGALSPEIRPLARGMSITGPVVTVQSRPGDNLLLHQAIYVAHPGDVLVVDCAGYTEAGQWGGIMMEAALARGIAGLITNGAVRDSDEIISRGFPVFARGICIKGTTKHGGGTINGRVVMDGVVIEPGDLARADSDGVVVVAKNDAEDVLAMSWQRDEREAAIVEALRAGKTTLDLYGFDTSNG